MSVVKALRNQSSYEYDNTFHLLYKDIVFRMQRIPKRKQEYVAKPLCDIMNKEFDTISKISYGFFRGRTKEKYNLVLSAIDILYELEKPLMVYQVIEHIEIKKIRRIVDMIESEVRLLNGLLPDELKLSHKSFLVLNWDYINNAEFMNNMVKLHRYTYSKVMHGNNALKYTASPMLLNIMDDALYQLVKANRKIPETYDEYVERRQCISNAILRLEQANRPMLSYFNVMKYSERIMMEWSEMLVTEIAKLRALQQSDAKRFKNLK